MMFLDQYSVVALEYHYYQNDCKYKELMAFNEHIDEDGNLIDESGEKATHALGTDKYQKNEADIHPMSRFNRQDVRNYYEDE